MNNHYVYLRVSTKDQSLQRQYEAMKVFNIPESNYFVEKISGKNTNRPELQKLLETVQEGDTIHIHEFSRLSRSTSDLLSIVEQLTDRGVYLVSNKENFDTSTATGRLMMTMIGAINSFERDCLLERQREGIKIAKANGAFKKKEIDMELFAELEKDVDSGLLTVTTACNELGITRRTWYNLRQKENA